ncbi:MAG: LysM peptidoglycan-binding domain-containing protein [Lentisphaerae bacterium]|nr:LysM peptidoglycan-binding domain-containing protein [Lentisphaerota bacterium]
MNLLKCAILAVAAIVLFSACSPGDERRHPLFIKGVKAQNNGNGAEAADCFRELIKRRPQSVYVHLKLAGVYDEMLNDPLSALLHYRLYLEAMPGAADAEEVKAWITQAEKRSYELLKERFEPAPMPSAAVTPQAAAASVPEAAALVQENSAVPIPEAPLAPPNTAPAVDAGEYAKLQKQLAQYQARHRYMLAELQRLRKKHNVQLPNHVPESTPPAAGSSGSGVRTYKVQPGDTPGKIARKLYGKSSLYKVILQANPAVNERSLKPGMILNIPDKPSR